MCLLTVSALSRAEQQTLFLQERQLQFKKAALKAKQNKDMELAKKYMKSSLVGYSLNIALNVAAKYNMSLFCDKLFSLLTGF